MEDYHQFVGKYILYSDMQNKRGCVFKVNDVVVSRNIRGDDVYYFSTNHCCYQKGDETSYSSQNRLIHCENVLTYYITFDDRTINHEDYFISILMGEEKMELKKMLEYSVKNKIVIADKDVLNNVYSLIRE